MSSPGTSSSGLLDSSKTWREGEFGLDRRLVKALTKLGYEHPTLVQSKSLPITLQGKDILVRARTGSGKTIAFALPAIQKVLQTKETEGADVSKIVSIVLAPTKELVNQIEKVFIDLIYYCRDFVSVFALLGDNKKTIDHKLHNKPNILISTPAKLAEYCKTNTGETTTILDLSTIAMVVIDEADLVLSYGYKQDLHAILNHVPKIFQGILLSATLSTELEKFKKVILHNPAILKLEEEKANNALLQFYVHDYYEADKYLILYVFMKLGLLAGKGLIFVNDISKSYRLKLFLQQFFIGAAVLNSEVPINSRNHILEEFNRGVFDYLIATDATVDTGGMDDDDEEGEEAEGEEGNDDEEEEAANDDGDNEGDEDQDEADDKDDEEEADNDDEEDEDNEDDDEEEGEKHTKKVTKTAVAATAAAAQPDSNLSKSQQKKLKYQQQQQQQQSKLVEEDDYGVSRGIDFTNVSFVINFDFPVTAAAYVHRIGRTARGMSNASHGTSSNAGTALSFVLKYNENLPADHKENALAMQEQRILQEVRSMQPRLGIIESDHIFHAIGATDRATSSSSSSSSSSSHQQQLAADTAAGDMAGSAGSVTEGSNSSMNMIEDDRMQPAPLIFNRAELDSFRYRVEDTLRSVTLTAVKELRAAEIRQEILNSEKLKGYFAENPNDLKILRHDKAILHPIQVKEHLKCVPDYLIPTSMKSVAQVNDKKKKRKNNNNNNRDNNNNSAEARKKRKQLNDPLYNNNANNKEQSSSATTGEGGQEAGGTAGGAGDSGKNRGQLQSSTQAANANYGDSASGRKAWKMRHQKGDFNPQLKKKQANSVPGTFLKKRW